MARHADVTVDETAWTQLTDGDASAIRVQNLSSYAVQLQATAGATAPETAVGRVVLPAGLIVADELSVLFGGVAGAARVWARTVGDVSPQSATLSVSHA